jgi:hypothetical protein
LGDQLAWIKGVLASSARLSDAEIEEHFSPSFLAHVPPNQLRANTEKLRALGPYSFRNYEGPPTAAQLAARVGVFSGEEARLTLAVDTEAPNRISGFAIFTQPPCTSSAG